MKTKKYTNIRIRQEDKDKLDILGRYLNRSLISTISDAIACLQLSVLERERRKTEARKQWDEIVAVLEKAKKEKQNE